MSFRGGSVFATVNVFLSIVLIGFFVHELPKSFQQRNEIWSSMENACDHVQSTTPCLSEVQNIVFIKVFKAGSSTFANLFFRYAYTRNLSVALPIQPGKGGLVHGTPVYKADLSTPQRFTSRKEKYNILAHHSEFYSEEDYLKYMPDDSVFVAHVREPLSRLRSNINFFQQKDERYLTTYLKEHVENATHYTELLKPPQSHMHFPFFKHVYDNKLAYFFGFFPDDVINEDLIKKRLEKIGPKFLVVGVLEYLPESLVLIKRKLCWKLKDVISIPVIPGSKKTVQIRSEASAEDKKLAHILLKPDYMVYEYFNRTFWAEMAKQGKGIYDEVQHLKGIIKSVTDFCDNSEKESIAFSSSEWNEPFPVSRNDCNLMRLRDVDYDPLFRERM